MRKWAFTLWVCLILLFPGISGAESSKFILLASTIGPIDSGIVDLLENEFEKETAIRVRHVGAGTGAALDIARAGTVDLCLAHAKALEEKFILEGYGTERIPFMYNDFIILGPASDPAANAPMPASAAENLGTPYAQTNS
jgi:tungstate transport system substrate-binding protein